MNMESEVRRPQELVNTGPMDLNWIRWQRDFLVYMTLSGGIKRPDDQIVACLKGMIGPVGRKAFESISFDNYEDKENMAVVMQKLGEYFDSSKFVIKMCKHAVHERQKFFMRSKKDSETVDAYIKDLKSIARNCKFREEEIENHVVDSILLNIKDKNLKKFILDENDLDLEKVKIIYKTYDLPNSNTKETQKKEDEPKPLKKKFTTFSSREVKVKHSCWRCGEKHQYGACPAWRSMCYYCRNLNHYSHRCPIARLDSVKIPVTSIDAFRESEDSSSPLDIEKEFKFP